jgi:hypothetical protein
MPTTRAGSLPAAETSAELIAAQTAGCQYGQASLQAAETVSRRAGMWAGFLVVCSPEADVAAGIAPWACRPDPRLPSARDQGADP